MKDSKLVSSFNKMMYFGEFPRQVKRNVSYRILQISDTVYECPVCNIGEPTVMHINVSELPLGYSSQTQSHAEKD